MVEYYSEKEYNEIAKIFGLGEILSISYLHIGFGGSAKVAVETSTGEYIISKDVLSTTGDLVSKSKESLQYEIDMLNTIKNLPVPHYKFSLQGKYIEKFDKDLVTVYNFIPGQPPLKISPPMAFQLGAFLGDFHKHGVGFQKTLNSRRKYYDLNLTVMKKMSPYVKRQKNPLLKSIVEKVTQGVKDNRPSLKLPIGPIHVDIGHSNELFEGKKLTGIIDFGNFYIGPFMVDIGKTIMWNCCPDGKLDRKLLREFIRGYASKRELNELERSYFKKALLYAICSHIWVDLYHVPIKYVPESWPLFLAEKFLPVAEEIEKSDLIWD